MFERKLSDDLIKNLKNEPLFNQKLLPDIKAGKVFHAIRKDETHFYYKGGRLLKYTKDGFKTNSKYASVIEIDKDLDISEKDIIEKKYKLIDSFSSGYERIKENCSMYANDEASGVSNLFSSSFIASNNDIVLLDIEASLESLSEETAQDRIDLVLFNKRTQLLKFVEVKHFSNSEIWSKAGKKPKVVEQINRYEKNLSVKYNDIISAYNNYINIINKFYDISLPEVKRIEEKVVLLIFGFDRDQQNKISKLLKDDGSLEDIKYYPIGDISNLIFENIDKKLGVC